MREATRYELRINDELTKVFDNMSDGMSAFKKAFEFLESLAQVGHMRLDALFPTLDEAEAFTSQFAKSAKVDAMANRIHLEPVESEAFTACVWGSYDPVRDGGSNEAQHRRMNSILRTLA